MDSLRELILSTGLRLSKATSDGPTWAHPTYEISGLPSQGIKLHVSATILSAKDVFRAVVPFLLEERVLFKVIASIKDLQKLNAGLFGTTQVGKFITVYPANQEEVFALADKLHNLTSKFQGPRVISDYKYKGIVYFRYGAFRSHPEYGTETRRYLLESPDGELKEDTRDPRYPVPIWFRGATFLGENREKRCACLDRFVITAVLRQRGRGGTYRGIELPKKQTARDTKVRKVILKQARYLGEVEFTGVDAQVRLLWYFRLLKELSSLEIVPQPYELFSCDEDIFLVMQDLEGVALSDLLKSYNYKPTIEDVLEVLIRVARIVMLLHERDILVVDLSPDNIIITSNAIYIIDLEHAWRPGGPPYSPMGTVGFVRPDIKMQPPSPQRDIFALGAIGYAMLLPNWFQDLHDKRHISALNEENITYPVHMLQDKELAEIIKKSLNLRYTSIQDLNADLCELGDKYGINQCV